MPGSSGGGNAATPRPPARGRRQHQATSLPFDVMVDIAACSDPATLVRFAATCREARHRVAEDPTFRRRLRLRHTADRFVLPLLRGHLVKKGGYYSHGEESELYLVDTAATDAIKVRKVTAGISSAPLASRDGLLLLHADKGLRVCEPATGRSQIIPSAPTFPGDTNRHYYPLQYVLLVGGDTSDGGRAAGGAIGRPFQLLIAKLEVSQHRRHLQMQIFSPERDAWGTVTEIRIPNLYGTRLTRELGGHLVVGGAVHWLCLTDSGNYVIKLHVRSAQVTISELPESFPCDRWRIQHLLATTSPGGSPIVLVNDGAKVSAWSQCKQTTKWKLQHQPVTDREKLVQFALNMGGRRPQEYDKVKLHWFAERSGIALIEIDRCGFFWLDLGTMKIVRWFSDPFTIYATVWCPYEIDMSSWVPTFSSTAV